MDLVLSFINLVFSWAYRLVITYTPLVITFPVYRFFFLLLYFNQKVPFCLI